MYINVNDVPIILFCFKYHKKNLGISVFSTTKHLQWTKMYLHIVFLAHLFRHII